MLENALNGSRRYWVWIFFLLAVIGVGVPCIHLPVSQMGLGITGMSRDVSWGLYIGQFTFLVGVAAPASWLCCHITSTITKIRQAYHSR